MAKEIKKNIYAVGAQDPDRRLFDALIPLPRGTSYNSYLIKGSQKTVLIDTVDPAKLEILFKNLEELKIKKIDYIVTHHGEQDHSGGLPEVLKKFPEAQVIANEKCRDLLIELLLIPADKIKIITDKEKLNIGDKNLQFIFTPWVHWPETFVTYLEEEKILFSCDFFGSHLATEDLYVQNEPEVFGLAKRYFAEIMMPFRSNIKKHLEILKNYQIDLICASHGPLYDQPKFIIKAYEDWTSDTVKNEVVIPYVSMHDSTRVMADHLQEQLEKQKICVKKHDLSQVDLGDLAMDLVDAATIVLGTPAVLIGPHPAAAYAAFLVNALRPKTKFLSIIGSFGWGCKVIEQLTSMLPLVKAEIIPPVFIKGYPKSADLKALAKLAEAIAMKHQSLNIL